MTLYIVRHAEAGERAAWTGDDRRRPLTATGRRQAEVLAELHAAHPFDRIHSSPARRCVDTVRPIAEQRGIPLTEDDALAEGTPFDTIDRLLRRASAHHVLLCSHGDVIGAIVTTLKHHRLIPRSAGWPKASTWILDGWPDPDGTRFVPPPAAV